MNRVPELRALTSARGIAAWLVVLFHIRLSIAGLPDAARAMLGKGYLAVDFFFLLSGFVIGLSWGQRLHDEGPRAIPAFLRKRFARVWPLHAVMLAASVALASGLALAGRPDPAFPVAALPLHVVLLQAWGSPFALAWNDPAWSISAEFAAYFAFPLIAMAVDWRRLPTAALLAMAAALLLGLHGAMDGAPTLGTDVARFGMVRCLFEFTTGTILSALWLRHRTRVAEPAMVAAIAVAGLASGMSETLAAPVALAAILLVLATDPRALRNGAIHYLGRTSYATYLSHFLLWKMFKLVAVSDAGHVGAGSIALYLALVMAASAVLYHAVERPAQAWLDRTRRRGGGILRPLQGRRPARVPIGTKRSDSRF